ncbi:MAG: hypothetical protein ACE5SW_00895 [Nitrososphaeraceae archaeon]
MNAESYNQIKQEEENRIKEWIAKVEKLTLDNTITKQEIMRIAETFETI